MRTLLSQAVTDRIGRNPNHPHFLESRPFEISPFMLARVLPGETLNNLYFESRAKLQAVWNNLTGWKMEYFFFYVRATDLMLDSFKLMFVDPENAALEATTALEDADGNAATYCAAGGIDWVKLALQRVTETYFRDEGEAWDIQTSAAGLPLAQIRNTFWLDSVTDKDDMPEGAAIAGAADMGDLDRLMDAFEMVRAMGLADMSYEDWLRSNGIAIPNKDENQPELIARFSDFVLPSTTVDTLDEAQAPKASVNFVFKNSHKKRMFFKEPGFLLGVSVLRPKMYFGALTGSIAGFATRAWDWMPNYLRDMPETSLRKFAAGTGPLPASTDDYFVDMRDDLLYGDQFVRPSLFYAGTPKVPNMPPANPAVSPKYINSDMIPTFGAGVCWQDGYTSLSIKGFEADFTNVRRAVEGG